MRHALEDCWGPLVMNHCPIQHNVIKKKKKNCKHEGDLTAVTEKKKKKKKSLKCILYFHIILHIYFIVMALEDYRNDHMDFYVTFKGREWPFFVWKKSSLDILQNRSFCVAQKKKAYKTGSRRWVHDNIFFFVFFYNIPLTPYLTSKG